MEKRKGNTASHQDEGWTAGNVGCMCTFVCAMSHGYVAKGCTAHLCDIVLAIP